MLGVGRYANLLPCPHARVARRADQQDAFPRHHGGRPAGKRRLAVQLPLAVRLVSVVVFVVPQRRVHKVAPHTVGKLGGHGPVVFLDLLFRLLVFRPQQPVAGPRGRAHIVVGRVHGHGAQYLRAVVGLGKDAGRAGRHEILRTADVYAVEGRYLVYILEPSVNDGYHHALAQHPDVVQPLALQCRNLARGLAVHVAAHAVALLKLVVVLCLDGCRTDRVGRLPHHPGTPDARQCSQTAHYRGVVHSYQQGVLPAALPNDIHVAVLYHPYVALAHRQVCRVDGQPLAPPPLYATPRQVPSRMLYRVSGALLVGQHQSVDVCRAVLVAYAAQRLLRHGPP